MLLSQGHLNSIAANRYVSGLKKKKRGEKNLIKKLFLKCFWIYEILTV